MLWMLLEYKTLAKLTDSEGIFRSLWYILFYKDL